MTAIARGIGGFLAGLVGLFVALLALGWVAETGGWVRFAVASVMVAVGMGVALAAWDSADA